MSEPRRNAKVFITDILEAIENIEMFTHEMTFEAFMKDKRTKDAVVRNLEIIGEAVKNIPESIKERYPDLDWKAVTGMRDKLIHEYFGVSLAIVWETVKGDLPPFKRMMEEILREFK
jgi:hypothetical protein